MGITTEELFAIGDEVRSGATEVHLRSAVGRYYYAAYHACQAWHSQLPAAGSEGSTGGVHQRFISQLRWPSSLCSSEETKKSKLIAAKLDICRTRRKVCDYELQQNIEPGEVQNTRDIARDLLDQTR